MKRLLLAGGMTMALLASGCDSSGGSARAAEPPRTARGPAENPPELGAIGWRHDYAGALAESKRTGLPVLVLFDEVPGCSTVLAFGKEVLSHQQVVKAATELFIPVVVYNNKGGEDRRILERWSEPSWNNPVVRIVDGNERELASRLTHAAGPRGVLLAMVAALTAAKRPVPAWLAAAAR
jgi:hypothetical protein